MCSSAILRLWSLGTVWGAMGSLKLQSREYSNVTSHQQQEQELVEFNVSPDESLLVLIWRQHWVVCQLQLLDGRRPIIVSPLMQIPQQPPTSGVSTAFFSLDGKKLFLLNFEYSCRTSRSHCSSTAFLMTYSCNIFIAHNIKRMERAHRGYCYRGAIGALGVTLR